GGTPLSENGEWILIGVAVAVALAGITLAVVRLKPAALVAADEAPPEHGIERVLANAYGVDKIYDDVVVQPVVTVSRNVLAKGIDEGLLDGAMVSGSAWLARSLGWIGSRLETGQVGAYAWAIALGALAVIGALTYK
ncbi:MAG TPA: hypothetical protein VEI06_02290, partial [Gemmatimonadaceae bacterium]|nr:hypothetical protein [Gemmatimonadaceae bacterium]